MVPSYRRTWTRVRKTLIADIPATVRNRIVPSSNLRVSTKNRLP
jgi:hypothetical protein